MNFFTPPPPSSQGLDDYPQDYREYRKIPKISPGAHIFKKDIFEGLILGGSLCTEGNMRFQIDWASLFHGRKVTIFTLFYFVFEGKFQVQGPRGAYIRRGDLRKGFLRYDFGGLIFGILW